MKIEHEYLTTGQSGKRLGVTRQRIKELMDLERLSIRFATVQNGGREYYVIPVNYLPIPATEDAQGQWQPANVPPDVAAQIEQEIEWINNAVVLKTPGWIKKKKEMAKRTRAQGIIVNEVAGMNLISAEDQKKLKPPRSAWPAGKSKERYQTRDRVLTISQARRISPRTKALIDKAGDIDIAPTIAYGVTQLGQRDNLQALIDEWRPAYTSYKGYSVAIVLNLDEAGIAQRLMDTYGLTLPELADLAIYTVAKDQGLT